jgi:fumarate reductase iron-sulfur subunit
MTVNGKARWTCRTHVAKVLDEGHGLEIAPLANLPVIKDLVTDMSEFFDKWARARGSFKGTATRHADFARIAPSLAAARGRPTPASNASGARVCYSSCDIVAWRPDFLGPAALNRAWTLVNDVRAIEQPDRLRAVAGDAGCHACHTQGSCTERCPKKIAPTLAIAGLKRTVANCRRAGAAVSAAIAQARRW